MDIKFADTDKDSIPDVDDKCANTPADTQVDATGCKLVFDTDKDGVMDELDVEYESLKLELNKNLDNERILEALVFNYKKRIELIENLLKQINSSKKTDNTNVYTL